MPRAASSPALGSSTSSSPSTRRSTRRRTPPMCPSLPRPPPPSTSPAPTPAPCRPLPQSRASPRSRLRHGLTPVKNLRTPKKSPTSRPRRPLCALFSGSRFRRKSSVARSGDQPCSGWGERPQRDPAHAGRRWLQHQHPHRRGRCSPLPFDALLGHHRRHRRRPPVLSPRTGRHHLRHARRAHPLVPVRTSRTQQEHPLRVSPPRRVRHPSPQAAPSAHVRRRLLPGRAHDAHQRPLLR